MNQPNRKSIRLPDHDYSAAGDYYITMCIRNRECLLGNIVNEQMKLSEIGLIANRIWEDLPNHYAGLQLGEWVVMPNHVHGILTLTGVGAIHESPENTGIKNTRTIEGTRAIRESPLRDERRQMLLSKIIGRFKMTSGKEINHLRNTPGVAVWQRNYFEHVIRNHESYANIEHYIATNPLNWLQDKEYK